MKNKFTLLLVIVLTTLISCNKKDLDNMRDRLAQIEVWQGQINSDVASLKKMVETLGAQDYVTNVTPLADGTGYTITFAKSGAIVIKNGKDGADAAIVGVKKDIDGKYYWTVGNEFIISDGKKIPTTGESPRIGENGNWWVGTTDTGIKAQGDSIFAQDGIDNSNPLYVELTLANGTKIQLLRKQLINIEPSADGGPYLIGPNGREIALTFLPGTFETGSIAGININIKGDNGSEENQYYPYIKEEKPSVALQAATKAGYFEANYLIKYATFITANYAESLTPFDRLNIKVAKRSETPDFSGATLTFSVESNMLQFDPIVIRVASASPGIGKKVGELYLHNGTLLGVVIQEQPCIFVYTLNGEMLDWNGAKAFEKRTADYFNTFRFWIPDDMELLKIYNTYSTFGKEAFNAALREVSGGHPFYPDKYWTTTGSAEEKTCINFKDGSVVNNNNVTTKNRVVILGSRSLIDGW